MTFAKPHLLSRQVLTLGRRPERWPNVLISRHKIGHNEERPYDCIICKATFKTTCDLKVHKTIHTDTGEKPFVREICKAAFPHNSILRIHILGHIEEKLFACEICGK